MSPLKFELFVFLSGLSIILAISNDICGLNNGKRFYLEYNESGSLNAEQELNIFHQQKKNSTSYIRCTVEFITCPSCVIEIQFRYLNISRNCGKASVYDTCGCDYVWIYEPHIEDASGEQFCGKFIKNNVSEVSYVSQTRTVAFAFIFSNAEYGQAFKLDYFSRRNRISIVGYPKYTNMNNASQYIISPFFPYLYPIDLSVEYVIVCESSEPCRISLLFTDFLVDESSIIEFFDSNGQRMYVISGNIFRPPAILSSGSSLVVRFYANGGTDLGFKASYSFILGDLDELAFRPNMGCGGNVNNLGGGITMMHMVDEGTRLFDCFWIIKPSENFIHGKTHLYLKVNAFSDFAGTTELIVRQGVTSTQPVIEVLRHPKHYSSSKEVEHVVPVSQGFYISFRGVFTPESRLEVIYTAFSYKDCSGGLDFLCHNLRCISVLLNCDGFDHCGDNSDEPATCTENPRARKQAAKVPNFFFPKMESYSDITTATFVFLTCSFGLIGVILAMALLLYRVNSRARHQRQLQDHIETIHAILEEGVRDMDEEIIIPDEPPVYEPPPEYNETLKLKYLDGGKSKLNRRCSHCKLIKLPNSNAEVSSASNLEHHSDPPDNAASTSRSCQTTPMGIPESPPPSYEKITFFGLNILGTATSLVEINQHTGFSIPGPSSSYQHSISVEPNSPKEETTTSIATKCLESIPRYPFHIFNELRKGFRSVNILKYARRHQSCSEDNLVRYFSDSQLILTQSDSSRPNKMNLKKSFSTDDLSLL